MSGWRADGNTHPKWRSCEHVAVNGRCSGCNARSMGDFTQVHTTSRGAVPLTDAQPVISQGTANFTRMKGDPGSADRFMHGSAHIEKDAA